MRKGGKYRGWLLMNEETKNMIVPKLRFPEFQHAGEWQEKTVGETCEILNNRRKPVSENDRVKGKYPYYGASGIVDYVNDYIFDERLLLIGEDGAKWGAFEKTAFIVDGKYWVNNHAHVLKPTLINDSLLENYLVMLDISKFITGAAPPKLTLGKLKEIPIPVLSSKAEQQKIADCLSSLDEIITTQTQKLEALKAHKKGLMQELFPVEGETVPKRRFKEFRDGREWKVKKIREIAELTSSKRVHLSDYVPNGIPFFRGKEISILKNKKFPDDILYITEELYEDIRNKYGVPKSGDILITAVGTLGNVYRVQNNDKFYFKDGNLIWLKNIVEDAKFLEILLDVNRTKVLASAIGSSQKALTMVELNKLEFKFPEAKEQEKIADCLSSLDELIQAQTEKIEELKWHKKGLMQGLFPNFNS